MRVPLPVEAVLLVRMLVVVQVPALGTVASL